MGRMLHGRPRFPTMELRRDLVGIQRHDRVRAKIGHPLKSRNWARRNPHRSDDRLGNLPKSLATRATFGRFQREAIRLRRSPPYPSLKLEIDRGCTRPDHLV